MIILEVIIYYLPCCIRTKLGNQSISSKVYGWAIYPLNIVNYGNLDFLLGTFATCIAYLPLCLIFATKINNCNVSGVTYKTVHIFKFHKYFADLKFAFHSFIPFIENVPFCSILLVTKIFQ